MSKSLNSKINLDKQTENYLHFDAEIKELYVYKYNLNVLKKVLRMKKRPYLQQFCKKNNISNYSYKTRNEILDLILDKMLYDKLKFN